MNQFLLKSKSISSCVHSDFLLFSTCDDSRAPLYYASPETDISPKEQDDLYGRLIEKKRVSALQQ